MDNESESTTSDIPRLKVSESAECLLLDEMYEMLSNEWMPFLANTKGGKRFSRIRAGAPAAGELARLIHEVQEKMSGDKYYKMQTFVKEFIDLPGVSSMDDSLLKLSVHLETAPPETSEVKNYPKRVLWLEQFCHITGTLVGQMDVILSFLRGREPRVVLKKTKDLLASSSDQAIQADTSSESTIKRGFSLTSLSSYCTLL